MKETNRIDTIHPNVCHECQAIVDRMGSIVIMALFVWGVLNWDRVCTWNLGVWLWDSCSSVWYGAGNHDY